MENSFLAHGNWSSISSEPSESGSSSIFFVLTNSLRTSSRWFALFLSFQTIFAGQQSKLTEKLENLALTMFLVVNEPEEQDFEKIKISSDSGIWLALAWNFLQCLDFFGWPFY
jgi:hypothetical protein